MFPLKVLGCKIIFVSLNFIRLPRVVITPSVRGENESKQSDESKAKFLCALSIFGISKIPTQCLKEALVTQPLIANGLFYSNTNLLISRHLALITHDATMSVNSLTGGKWCFVTFYAPHAFVAILKLLHELLFLFFILRTLETDRSTANERNVWSLIQATLLQCF